MISVDTSIHLESIEWLNAGTSSKNVIYLEEKRPGLYVSNKHFVEPRKSFRIWVRTITNYLIINHSFSLTYYKIHFK